MVEYTISMERSPSLSDAQVRTRLAYVYRLLLEIARCKGTADSVEAADPEPSAADDARLEADVSPCPLRSAGLSRRGVPVA